MPLDRFEDLWGHTLKAIENREDEELIFTLSNGEQYKLYHDQECCERVYIDDIIGNLEILVGEPIMMAEEISNADEPQKESDWENSFTWTFYKLGTSRGYVTVRWYGSSNGYYSESVSWERVL